MTVHTAQGSEVDEVWLVLPERDNRVLSRELVYTGMTRARSVLHVAGSADVNADSLARPAGRWSGLGWRLRFGMNLPPFCSAPNGEQLPQHPATLQHRHLTARHNKQRPPLVHSRKPPPPSNRD